MDEEVKIKIEPEFNRALKLRDDGDLSGAIEIFRELDDEYPNQAVILGMWASIYFQTNDWENALLIYQRLVVLSPKSELASLGLFHSLFSVGQKQEAFNEMRRFLSISTSQEYWQLINELEIDVSNEIKNGNFGMVNN